MIFFKSVVFFKFFIKKNIGEKIDQKCIHHKIPIGFEKSVSFDQISVVSIVREPRAYVSEVHTL